MSPEPSDYELTLCPVCHVDDERYVSRWYDRHGIYSGRACEPCAHTLPGQGEMWFYDAEEPIEEPD